MSFGLLFWILMLISLLFGLRSSWPGERPIARGWLVGNSLVLFILLLLIGWKVFGAPVHP